MQAFIFYLLRAEAIRQRASMKLLETMSETAAEDQVVTTEATTLDMDAQYKSKILNGHHFTSMKLLEDQVVKSLDCAI